MSIFPFCLNFELQISFKKFVTDSLIPPLIKLNRTQDPNHGEDRE